MLISAALNKFSTLYMVWVGLARATSHQSSRSQRRPAPIELNCKGLVYSHETSESSYDAEFAAGDLSQ